MLESLLIFYCRKDSRKKNKVKKVLETIEYNETTKEYFCKSTTKDKTYCVIYSTTAKYWKCSCPYLGFVKYRTFDNVHDRNRLTNLNDCCHIIATKIHKALLQKQ